MAKGGTVQLVGVNETFLKSVSKYFVGSKQGGR